jgi:pimeloyl-ACP methyl ester carboxylesterase
MLTEVAMDKPLALLIPGLDGTGRLYYRQLEGLSARYRVRAWEFCRRDAFDFADLVQELAEGTAGEAPGSILVVGESFGGPVALHYVLAYPERVRALALVNSFPAYRRKIRIRLACRLAFLLNWRVVRRLKDSVAERILAGEGILPEDRRRYHEIIQLIHRPAYQCRLELVRDVALRHRLSEISVPTCIFTSGRDKIVPSRTEGRFMASRIPSARLFEFPDAGHALLLTPGFSLADYF